MAASSVAAATRTVAAFDFDGTLTRRDTLVPFLTRVRGRAFVARALASSSPVLLRTAAGLSSRQRAKEALLIRTLRGWWLDELQPIAAEYAHDVVANEIRPDRLARLQWHRQQGHDVVLVSASPDLYVAPCGLLLGCTTTLASQLEVDRHSRLTGRLFGPNVRGPEKERLLRSWLGSAPVHLWAYGDSDGDADMLAMADVGVRLRGGEKLSAAPEER